MGDFLFSKVGQILELNKPHTNNCPSIPAKAGTHELPTENMSTMVKNAEIILKPAPESDKQQSLNSASMAAEAATHELPIENISTIVRDAETAHNKPYRPKKGNKAIEIPPLIYDPTTQNAWVYIVANKPNGTIYVGQTTNLPRRSHEHKEGKIEGFSKEHGCNVLVYFEGFERITDSIEKETKMKNWPRDWKIRRILATNPEWRDLHAEICK